MLLILSYMVFQLLPLPPWFVSMLSPQARALYADTLGLLGIRYWMPLTICPHDTLDTMFLFVTAAVAYVLLVQIFADARFMRWTVMALIAFAGILAVLSITERHMVPGKVLCLSAFSGRMGFGPYLNRNHYACFAGMILPLAVAMFFHHRPSIRYMRFWENAVDFLNHPFAHHHLLIGFSAVVLGVSVFVSKSRGGVMAMFFSLATLGLMSSRRGPRKKGAGCAAGTLCLTVLLAVGWFGWKPLFDRFMRIRDASGHVREGRLDIWTDSAQITRDFPVFGTGWGTFEVIYPTYRDVGGLHPHAHNDYLEILTDSGLVGVILAGTFFWAVLPPAWQRYRRRRDPYMIALFQGSFAGIVYMAVHAVVDFNFHVPANALLFVLLLALLASSANTRRHGIGRARKQATWPIAASAWSLPLSALAGLLIIWAAAVPLYTNSTVTDAVTVAAGKHPHASEVDTIIRRLEISECFDPLHSLPPLLRGKLLLDRPGTDAEAFDALKRALLLSPSNADTLSALANAFATGKDPINARLLFESAVRRAPMRCDIRKQYATWLMENNAVAEAMERISQAIRKCPERTTDFLEVLTRSGAPLATCAPALPDIAAAWLAYAGLLEKNGAIEHAQPAYRRAFILLSKDPAATPGQYMTIVRFFRTRTTSRELLSFLRQAISVLPQDPVLRLEAARTYEQCGIAYRAREEYEKVLLLSPGNTVAGKGLWRLSE